MRRRASKLIIATILVALAAILYPALVLNTGAEGIKEIPPDKTVLAIYSIEARGVDASLAEALSPFLMGAINNNRGKAKIVQNEAVSKALEQQGLASSGACSDTECLPALGKILGANRFLVTSLTKLGKKYTVHATVYDAESAIAMFTDREECHCSEDELNIPVERLANRVMARLNGKEIKQPVFNTAIKPKIDTTKPKVPQPELESLQVKGAKLVSSLGKLNRGEKITFSPDWSKFAIQSNGTIKLHDISTGKIIKSLQGFQRNYLSNEIYTLTFSPDGNIIVFGGCDKQKYAKGKYLYCTKPYINIHDIPSGRNLGKIKIKGVDWFKSIYREVSFSPDSNKMAYQKLDGKIVIWDISSASEIITFKGHSSFSVSSMRFYQAGVSSLIFSPSGKMLASSGKVKGKASVKLWDITTGKELNEFSDFGGMLTFSLNGKILAQNSNGTAKLWRISEDEPSSILIGGNVEALMFSKDSKVLNTFGCEYKGVKPKYYTINNATKCIIKSWDVDTGSEIGNLAEFNPAIPLAFSPDGKRIALINKDGTIQIWALDNAN